MIFYLCKYILFNSLISIFTMNFFDVRTILNNHILQCSDFKCTYNIEPLQIDDHILQSSNILFSKRDQFLNHI